MEKQFKANADKSRQYIHLINYRNTFNTLQSKTSEFDSMERQLRFMRTKVNQQIGGGSVSSSKQNKISKYFDQMSEDIRRERRNSKTLQNNISKIDFSSEKYGDAHCKSIDENHARYLSNQRKLSNNMERLAQLCMDA